MNFKRLVDSFQVLTRTSLIFDNFREFEIFVNQVPNLHKGLLDDCRHGRSPKWVLRHRNHSKQLIQWINKIQTQKIKHHFFESNLSFVLQQLQKKAFCKSWWTKACRSGPWHEVPMKEASNGRQFEYKIEAFSEADSLSEFFPRSWTPLGVVWSPWCKFARPLLEDYWPETAPGKHSCSSYS